MITGRTILCFASGYDAPPTSKHHVMHQLAQENAVLWVNYHASRKPSMTGQDLRYLGGRLRRVFQGLSRARENLYVLTPLVLPLPGCNWAREVNRMMLIHQIRIALAGMGSGPLQIWSFCPDTAYLVERLSPERVLYYCVDDFASFTGYDADQVLRDEAELCRLADLVVTSSQSLMKQKRKLNERTIHVSHGVDYQHFSRALRERLAVPEDLRCIARPRIGFFGLIRDWVDLRLIARIARRRGKWQFVFLGDSTVDLSAFTELENVHFLGARPYGQLPAYCRHFDVGMIPFKLNDLTQAANPIKLREYLAAGLPVVSTPLNEVKSHADQVETAEGEDAFEAAIDRALRASPTQRAERSKSVGCETWRRKVERICAHLMVASRPNASTPAMKAI